MIALTRISLNHCFEELRTHILIDVHLKTKRLTSQSSRNSNVDETSGLVKFLSHNLHPRSPPLRPTIQQQLLHNLSSTLYTHVVSEKRIERRNVKQCGLTCRNTCQQFIESMSSSDLHDAVRNS